MRTISCLPFVFCIAALFGLGRFAVAEDTTPTQGGNVISENTAIRMGLENSKELAFLARDVKAQEMIADFARCSVNNPEVRIQDVSTKYTREDDKNRQFEIGLRWQPPKYGELALQKQEELVKLGEARVKHQEYRLELIMNIKKTHAEFAMLKDAVPLAESQSKLEEKRLAVVRQLVKLGQSPLLDEIKARKRFMKSKSEAAGLRQRLDDCRSRFKALTGVSDAVVTAPGGPPILTAEDETVRKSALEHREDLKLAALRADLFRRRYNAERNKLLPALSFIEVDHHLETERLDWQELRLGVELPIFNWNIGNMRGSSLLNKNRAETHGAATEVIAEDLDAALSRYRRTLAEWRSTAKEAEDFLPRVKALIEAEERYNTLSNDDAIELQLAEIETKRLVLDASYAATEAAAELCVSGGVERLEDLGR